MHKIFHGDFLGAKALNGAVVLKDGLRIGVLTTHLHAEYDRVNDEYLAHRVAQVIGLSKRTSLTSHTSIACQNMAVC